MKNSPSAEVYDPTVPSLSSVDVADKTVGILNAAKRTMSLGQYASEDLVGALVAAEFDGATEADAYVVHIREELLRRADRERSDKASEGIIQGKDADYDITPPEVDGNLVDDLLGDGVVQPYHPSEADIVTANVMRGDGEGI